MKYGFMAMVMPMVFDKTIYSYLNKSSIDIGKEFKQRIRQEYKSIVKKTPGLAKGNSLLSTLYIGCYLISFHKAWPDVVNEQVFSGMIETICNEMIKRQKEDESAFSEKTIRTREIAAEKSQTSDYEMDWVSTFERTDNGYEFTYTKCGLCELGRREGCFQLIKYLCKTDYISFDKSGAKLVREHTIANGDGFCDFHVSRKESAK